jgi:hypothetical protein
MRQITPPVDDFITKVPPFYLPVAGEVTLFEHAHQQQIPVLLKGPTGCGKTRFVAAMAHHLGRPLITVACHEDLSASDLIGRYLIQGDETVWVDGPLTTAVRHGAILYLDEVVEARKDTMVVIHPLTDHRRVLPVDKLACVLKAPPEFMLVVSYLHTTTLCLPEFRLPSFGHRDRYRRPRGGLGSRSERPIGGCGPKGPQPHRPGSSGRRFNPLAGVRRQTHHCRQHSRGRL